MKIEPLGRRALIRKVDGRFPVVFENGHVPVEGVVVEIGEACGVLSVGDRVLVGRYAGTELTIDGSEHVLLDDCEVLAKVLR